MTTREDEDMLALDELTDVGLGTWVLGESMWKGRTDPDGAIQAALDGGINVIDTAPVYGRGKSERVVGRNLRRLGVREDVFLATKCGLEWEGDQVWRNSSPDRLREEIRRSLERLHVDCIDLYQIHWPDHEVPFEESVEVLESFRSKGWIRYVGLSNFGVEEIKRARRGGTIDFLQPPYNLFERKAEEKLLPFCRSENIRTLIYGALCRGLLTGKYREPDDIDLEPGDVRGEDPKFTDRREEYVRAVNRIRDYLTEQGHREELAPLMIRWTALQPGVSSALVGARSRAQAESNARALEVSLTPGEVDGIRRIADDVVSEPVEPTFMAPPEQPPTRS